jgi:GDPmannose 4,6-dehydratase
VFAVAGLDWRDHVVSDPALHRPAEVDLLCGDASKARDVLGWQPSLRFAQIARRLAAHDLAEAAAA